MFDKVLIANRGEIAVRVIKACRELGVGTVAVYSDADAGALFTELADEAVHIGGTAPSDSYLKMEAVIEAAEQTGAEAIHPGYGFLSENPAFARAVDAAGLVFVGPTGDSMEALGDKVQARETAAEVGVPTSPGSDDPLADEGQARKVAEAIGYPILFKAAAGGGGMGMRLVESEDGLSAAFQEASQQAESAFGDGRLFIEKFHTHPRHIEIQLLGLEDGAVHLGERECSIQRRYQKLIEEAPSPAVDAELREEIGQAAVTMAEAVGYRNAGTAEFLLTDEGFYFNELNARLQVEHPVTELVTGVDLVKAQLRIAAGQDPGVRQADIELCGHAIECRINAEDPLANFAPNPGKLTAYREPKGPFVRIDSGFNGPGEVRGEYDSMIAKAIVWGQDRDEARSRMTATLRDFEVAGVKTVIPLHLAIMQEPRFAKGEMSTKYLEEVAVLDTVRTASEDARRQRYGRIAAIAAALHATGGLYAVANQRPVAEGPAATWHREGDR